jgi:nicotinamidase-related amidase
METIIDKNTTALVVIDLQKGIVGMEGQPYQAANVVKNAASMAETFRKNNMPVFLVRVATSADGKDRLNPTVDGENPWGNRQLPPDWAEIVPEMGPKEGDFVITKKQWGAFYGTELDLQLRRRGITTIVLCGIATNIGVESTARFAFEYGFQQIFVEDAMTTRSAAEHEMSVKSTFVRLGRIRKTQDILSVLK